MERLLDDFIIRQYEHLKNRKKKNYKTLLHLRIKTRVGSCPISWWLAATEDHSKIIFFLTKNIAALVRKTRAAK